ncbi:hypothetical protein K458DRAFT_40479 [Lentithecium fluviatile CBS 122367]|uniref:Uncharacterized protein n=1 Tax=Lentithecium fluviatile CBS 122367 TaxID=1168545 RepID=A0A6G1IZF9_9PLEO|nr:hypothetical protein K458DRAFT_40479 [Lentithecium fluviatile CBS 122367]
MRTHQPQRAPARHLASGRRQSVAARWRRLGRGCQWSLRRGRVGEHPNGLWRAALDVEQAVRGGGTRVDGVSEDGLACHPPVFLAATCTSRGRRTARSWLQLPLSQLVAEPGWGPSYLRCACTHPSTHPSTHPNLCLPACCREAASLSPLHSLPLPRSVIACRLPLPSGLTHHLLCRTVVPAEASRSPGKRSPG